MLRSLYVVVKTNSALDIIKINTLQGSSRVGIIFEKIQGRISLTNLKTFEIFVFHNYQK